MAKYHINPRTGNPGICRARLQCRFGGAGSHFATKEEARADYEDSQERLARKAASPREALANFEKEFSRGLETLDNTYISDGSAFGSSRRSRAEASWKQANYLIGSYVDKKDGWDERRGYYHQVENELRKIKREFTNNGWGEADSHKPLVEHLERMEKDFASLSGPEGARREKELGFYKE